MNGMLRPLPTSFSRILAISLAIALALRIVWPLADPPPGMSWSTGAYTDPPSNALAARYAVEGGPARAIDVPERLIYPAYHVLARIAYQTLGVRRLSTVLLAALLGTATVAFLALAVRRGPGDLPALLAAILGATSAWLVPNSRILTPEGVALFLLAIACFFAMSHRRIDWLAAGATAAVAGLLGKYHALAFLPALLIFLAARAGWRAAAIASAGALAIAAAWGAAIFFPYRAEIVQWVRQSSVGGAEASRGGFLSQHGWLAPFEAFKDSWLAYRMPIVAVIGLWFSARTLGSREMLRRRIEDGSALFVLWSAVSFVSTSLLSYTAPRYFTLVAAPLIACAAGHIASLWKVSHGDRRAPHASPPVRSKSIGAIPLFAWAWIAAFTLLHALVRFQTAFRTRYFLEDWVRDPRSLPGFLKLPEAIHATSRHVVVSLILAAAATAIVLLQRQRRRSVSAPAAFLVRRRAALSLLAGTVVFDLILFGMWASHRSSTIEIAKASIREILPSNAVILGGFAPLLTEGSELIAVPQFGRLEEADLQREPRPTHILFYGTNATDIKASQPILEGRSEPVARWPIRTAWTRDLVLYRLLSPDGRPVLEPSLYERALEQLALGSTGEAAALAEEYRLRHGETLTQILLSASCRFADESSPAADELYRRAAQLNPQDPLPLRNLGWRALWRGDEDEARTLWMRALAIDPSDPELADLVRPLLVE